mmetsp:Transcript_22920/g.22225  ORF Transcript_22920/g.22225 Transcript_22920/m.22225 type:complete len:93 (-) Transcript_22920:363-641(-)
MALYTKLEYLYNYSSLSQERVDFREQRAGLVILDRTFDMVSPLVHDYTYQSALFDYLEVPEDGSLEAILPREKSPHQKQAASDLEHKLTDLD